MRVASLKVLGATVSQQKLFANSTCFFLYFKKIIAFPSLDCLEGKRREGPLLWKSCQSCVTAFRGRALADACGKKNIYEAFWVCRAIYHSVTSNSRQELSKELRGFLVSLDAGGFGSTHRFPGGSGASTFGWHHSSGLGVGLWSWTSPVTCWLPSGTQFLALSLGFRVFSMGVVRMYFSHA